MIHLGWLCAVLALPAPWSGRARLAGLAYFPLIDVGALAYACWFGRPIDSPHLGLAPHMLVLDVVTVLALTMVPGGRRWQRPSGRRVLVGHPG